MPLASEIHFYRSSQINDTASNGGRLSTTQEPSGLSNSLWPDVDPADATAGKIRYRKLFLKSLF